ARAGELWHRTTIVASRRLAATAGVPVRQFGRYWRLSYAKVIEFQARGVVHVHALVRLDRQANDGNAMSLDSSDLAVALAAAAARAAVPNPLLPDRPIRWGAQIDIDPIDPEHRRRSAAYLAKYATKSVDGAGALDHRLRSGQLDRIDLPAQLRRMAATAWELGGRPELADLNLRAWAHNLGWRGHWLTKSAHWSTTFAQLRAVRRNWRLQEAGIDPEETAGWWGDWEYQGSGHLTAGDAWLADRANQSAKLNRRTAWEES
ncbi:MAG TPA: replication initiator, partial [Acidimicrobiales bacterium]|nr:replication initiator [Acidimicrobiales bacterium]